MQLSNTSPMCPLAPAVLLATVTGSGYSGVTCHTPTSLSRSSLTNWESWRATCDPGPLGLLLDHGLRCSAVSAIHMIDSAPPGRSGGGVYTQERACMQPQCIYRDIREFDNCLGSG